MCKIEISLKQQQIVNALFWGQHLCLSGMHRCNVGTLYDTCNQVGDARDAYQKAIELGAKSSFIRERFDALSVSDILTSAKGVMYNQSVM